MKRRIGLVSLMAFGFAAAAHSAGVNSKEYLDDVTYLASKELKGRATGSPELEKAASYIASRFQSFGVKPADGKNYLQAYTAELDAKLGPNNTFSSIVDGKKQSFKIGRDFQPFAFSTNGQATGAIVFAGYGITAKDLKYDDYEGLDVKDKFVLILRHEPQENDDKSVFSGKKATSYSAFTDKMVNAKMHGARGVILVNDVYVHPTRQDRMEKLGASDGPRDAGIFFIQVKEDEAEKWLTTEGRDLKQIAADIDKDLKPRSFALNKTQVDVAVDLVHEKKTVHNVAAYIPGKTSEYVILGAHFDHLGLGDSHSLAPQSLGTIHPGADDNASGTAGVIELARWFSKQPQMNRGVLFLLFSGEELGLLGSNHYVNNPLLPPGNAIAMINLDMIGRIKEGKVFVSGIETGTTFEKVLQSVDLPEPLKMDRSGKNSGTNMNDASDHASFATKEIPVLFFFSGLHGDYHKPTDTADKIDAEDAAKLVDYVAQVTEKLADANQRPQFVKVAPSHGGGANSGIASSAGGYGPDFGSIPDFNEPPKGVRFSGVREGSPAQKAGLKGGDIMIEFDGKVIGNLYDFTYTLRDHKAGDLVLVKVLRGTQTIEAKVLLTERR